MASTESSVLQHDHVHIEGERCPWCDQPITHDKFEEIQARIKQEERERAKALERSLRETHQAALKAKDAEREEAVKAATQTEKDAAMAREKAIRAEVVKETEAATAKQLSEADARAAAAEGQIKALNEAAAAEKKAAAEREKSIREDAKKQTEAALNKKITDADTRAQTAEAKLEQQTATHKQEMETLLKTELGKANEAYEKDLSEQLSQVRATEFAKYQKLQNKTDALQRELNKKTSNEIGDGEEVKLFDVLRDRYPGDTIERIQKGEPGADIRHEVYQDGQLCGTILYDSKARKAWQHNYATKLRDDQLSARAEHAVLSSFKFPAGQDQLCEVNGVIVASPARVPALVDILRRDVIRSHRLKLSGEDRAKKSAKLYEFVTGEQFVQKLARVDELATELLKLDEKEIQAHQRMWEKRGTKERAIQKANTDLRIEIDSILEG